MLIALGYAAIYTGAANLHNGGQGPTLLQSLGFAGTVAPPGSDQPNLMGQPPKAAQEIPPAKRGQIVTT